jgi:lytic murein transglycosylase
MLKSKMLTRVLCASVSLMLTSCLVQAASCGNNAQGFEGFIKSFRKQAASQGVGGDALAVLDDISYDAGVIKKDRAQNVFSQSFLQFQGRMVTDYRIKHGAELIQKNKSIFSTVEKKFGVPAPVIVAFWALETDFGANIGDLPTVQSLATLSWDCRRPEKFRPQLLAALELIQRGDLRADEMRGAWAGEIGQTQFLPYDYNESAVDFDGDGKRDLRNSVPDVIASSANLLRKHGWQPGQPWMHEVRVPDDMPWDQADIAIQHPRSQWAKWGVKSAGGKPIKSDNFPASLLLPMGKDGPAFLVYENFTTAYLKWNESLVYSTTAAYLATRIAGAGKVGQGNAQVTPLTYNQVASLQKILAAKGYDVGKIDGKIGAGTRAAVKEQQMKLGLPADSYPTLELLQKLGG